MNQATSLSVVMPVYNEAEVIESVIRDLERKVLKQLPGTRLIVAEDGSTDGTKDILSRLKQEIPFELISGRERKGYTRAFTDALALAETEWVFFSDSDGQHDPEDILRMLEAADDFDIISGRKMPRRDPIHRRACSWGYNFLIAVLFHLKMRDIDSGFKLIRKKVIDQILPQVKTMKYCVMSEFLLRAYLKGYSIKEVPVRHYPRLGGQTAIFHPQKLPGIILELVRNLWAIKKELRKGQS